MDPRLRVAGALVGLFAAVTLALGMGQDAQAGTKRALLIGINDYINVPDLRGAVNDVEMLRQVLTTRFGFAADDIEIVINEEATRAGIIAAFERLAARSQPDDILYVHYSGHGSQMQDMNGDEPTDGMDETLIPHDGRTEGIADITDDELGELLGELSGEHVVIVLDSCHSGTATRGWLQPRGVPPDTRIDLYRRTATRGVVPLTQGGHILMTGSADDEEALDGPVDGRPHGLFSYALAKSLANAPKGATPRAIFAGVESELERIKAQLGLRSMPEPQLEAEPDRLDVALLPDTAPSPPSASPEPEAPPTQTPEPARVAWLEAQPEGPGTVRLLRGPSLGAVAGSIWAIYPPGETRFQPGKAVAQAEVRSVGDDHSIARLDPGDAKVKPGSRATAIAPAPSADRIPVRLLDRDEARGERLRAAIAGQLEAVAFVGTGEFARFVVAVEREQCRVLAADGLYELETLPVESDEQLANALVAIFARSMTAAELLSLDHPATSMKLELAVTALEPPRDRKGPERGLRVVASTEAPRFHIRKAGEPRSSANSLRLRVRASHACYLTVVDVDAEGGILLLFPNAISESKGYVPDGKLSRGQEILIPDSLEPGNAAGFYADYAPPAGTDTVRAFCSADRATAQALRESIGQLGGSGSAEPDRRSVRDVLVGSLRAVLSRSASRGLVLVAAEDEPPPQEPIDLAAEAQSVDWVARSLTIQVED